MTDQLGDVLKEIRNPDLSPQRLEEIGRLFNAFDDRSRKVQSWLRFADNNPQFDTVYSRFGEFEVSPIMGFAAYRIGAQSINDNTSTNLAFNSVTAPNSAFSNTSISSRIALNAKVRMIGVVGTVEWATDGTGRRGCHLDYYDHDDVQISGVVLHSLLPTGIAEDTLPVAGGLFLADIANVAYVRVSVVQTSGGALNVNTARMHFFALI